MERLKRRMPAWPGGLRHRLERQRSQMRAPSRGQALVEFALVAPLFLLLLFGVVEYSLINASIGAFNFAAKEGARNEAIIGNGQPPTPYSSMNIDQYVVQNQVMPHITGLVMAQVQEVVIFKSDQTGNCYGQAGVQPPSCTQENTLTPGSGGTWNMTTGWTTPRNDQLSNADYVGVYIAYTYTYLTAFFAVTSPTLHLAAVSVQRIEPQQFGWHGKSPQIVSIQPPLSSAPIPLSDAFALVGVVGFAPRREFTRLAGDRA